MKNNKILKLIFASSVFSVLGCSSSTSTVATPENLSTSISSASTYLSQSLPNFSNTVGAAFINLNITSPRTLNIITPAIWASASGAEQTIPPGGQISSPGLEPTYGGAAIPTSVNYRDYMKMALDPVYSRYNSNGNFSPTVFGRFTNMIQALGYISSSGITTDAEGMPAPGDYNVTLNMNGQDIRIIAAVTSTSNTTYYDRKLDIYGFIDTNANTVLDGGEQKVFANLIWMRNTVSQLNFMMVELGDRDSNATIDTFGVNVISWNRSTGDFAFEYVSTTDDAITSAQLETFRARIESTNGKSWLYGFSGKANATLPTPDYIQYALYAPSTAETAGTVSLREIKSNGDIWLGNLCSTFTTGVATAGETAGDADPASGGTCTGQAADSINTKAGLMGFANIIRSKTTWIEVADDKGFPATTYSNWSTAEARTAWQNAGETVGVSFSNTTTFIAQWDSTP